VARSLFRSTAAEWTFGKAQFSEVLNGSMRRLPRLLPLFLATWGLYETSNLHTFSV